MYLVLSFSALIKKNMNSDKHIIDLVKHWNSKYESSEESKLGWFETDLSPMLKLIDKADIKKEQAILIAGAGNTRLLDELIALDYKNIIATDLSESALLDLKSRIQSDAKVNFIVDDLTQAKELNSIEKIDLWIDRAVLHFFHEENELKNYVKLLHSKLKNNGYAIFAEFSTDGALMCSGLPVKRYDQAMLQELLGSDYTLIDSFSYTYIMPSGAERPYIYSLYKRN